MRWAGALMSFTIPMCVMLREVTENARPQCCSASTLRYNSSINRLPFAREQQVIMRVCVSRSARVSTTSR